MDWVRVDQLLALGLLAEIELQVWLSTGIPERPAASVGGVVIALSVAFRRRWPLRGMLVLLAVLLARTFVGGGAGMHQPVGVMPALILLVYGMGAFAPPRRSQWALALLVVISSANNLSKPGNGLTEAVVSEIIVVLVPYTLGRWMRARAARAQIDREHAERLDATRELSAQTAALEERTRIARELHDVIAHSVSLMVIQAGGARLVMDAEPDRAEESLLNVERAGRDALAEMRALLGALGDGRDPRALAPQPGLAELDGLLVAARESGVQADLHVDGEPATVSPALDLCAYRIIQEALTNAIKHAAPARAAVRVSWQADALELEISDDGSGSGAVNGAAGGHGIAGMRERVALHGGSVDARPRAGGGFAVRAQLPLAQELAR
ncbi:MAG: sensor histidine kinase [Solirubrobacteraceae bacterium]